MLVWVKCLYSDFSPDARSWQLDVHRPKDSIQVIDPSCDISWEIMVSGHWPERPLQDLCAGAQLRSLSLFKSVVGSTWHDWMILDDFVWGEATGKMT